jgi:hypothetical protein
MKKPTNATLRERHAFPAAPLLRSIERLNDFAQSLSSRLLISAAALMAVLKARRSYLGISSIEMPSA